MLYVAVCTFRRPEQLALTLNSIGHAVSEVRARASIVVADNDATASASQTVERFRATVTVPVYYLIEPVQNIALVRNRCLDLAKTKNCDAIAFIDDDECADPSWLKELLAARTAYGAHVVFGPVLPEYPSDSPRWIVEGQFFERQRHETGAEVQLGGTGNVLIDRRFIEYFPLRFAPEFGLTGGSDTEFFSRCAKYGARMIWSDKAIVRETVQRSRMNLRWLLRRSFRNGQVYSRVFLKSMEIDNKLVWIVRRFAGLLLGFFGALIFNWLNRPLAIRSLCILMRNLGQMLPNSRWRIEEYRRVGEGKY